MTPRMVAVAGALILVVAACSSGGDESGSEADRAGPTTTTERATTTTSTTIVTSTTAEPEPEPAADTEETAAPGYDSMVLVEPADAPPLLLPASPGDSGGDVVALQERLADLGFAPGSADGSYGGRTVAAIEAFQELVELEPTGEADLSTIAALTEFTFDGVVLHVGDEGPDVEALQERLKSGPFDPGVIDGEYGGGTRAAVWALEKLAGVPVDGDWGPLDERAWELLESGAIGAPELSNDQRWVEVDLSQQLVKVYDPGSTVPVLVSHASSGSGVPWANEEHSGSSITPLGDFHINRRISGWRESSLNIGRLYNPLYFNGGIAFHGATSVPLYPASHGCVRLPMHIADYLPAELPNGTPVHVLA